MRDSATRLTVFEAALRELPTESLRLEYPQQFVRYSVGRMLFERGDLRQAERYFRSFYQYDFTHLVPAQYYLGQIYEALDRPEDALEHYRLFVDWWRDSDPELRPWWEEGREGLARLSGEPREPVAP
jgi:tetratricopeptide (TPR) repeat protein